MVSSLPNVNKSAAVHSEQDTMFNKPMSLVFGPSKPPLWSKTLGTVIHEQAKQYGSRTAVSVPWQSTRLTYQQMSDRSKAVAKSILEMGLRHGDCIGIMAGNCYQYIEVFLGCARIGCPAVVLNNTYSPEELKVALSRSNCKLLFIAPNIGQRKLSDHIQMLLNTAPRKNGLRHLICLDGSDFESKGAEVQSYSTFISSGRSLFMNDDTLLRAERKVTPSDVLNLQFTSGKKMFNLRSIKQYIGLMGFNPGTTGLPKAAMLTHTNLINNGRFVGHAMKLTEEDVICCPPPLFHCFGLVIGFLASFCHGSTIVFPSSNFDAQMTLEAILQEKATALLGVPTMFISELEVMEKKGYKINTIRTGLAAGSPVPQSLMHRLEEEMNINGMLIAYGMTETSPVTFITALNDSEERKCSSIGQVLPHTGAKVVNKDGNIVPTNVRGELCTSGFALQKGYWKEEAKTKEVMISDENGIIWMHTGDEAFIDEEGYGHITGRIKDIIIRGGENISPAEIENRLLEHPSISECCVVGLEDLKYGEMVGCFLRRHGHAPKLSDNEVQEWVKQVLGRIKAPQHIFWLGGQGIGNELPKTGSGKYQKHLIREIGNRLLKQPVTPAKL